MLATSGGTTTAFEVKATDKRFRLFELLSTPEDVGEGGSRSSLAATSATSAAVFAMLILLACCVEISLLDLASNLFDSSVASGFVIRLSGSSLVFLTIYMKFIFLDEMLDM